MTEILLPFFEEVDKPKPRLEHKGNVLECTTCKIFISCLDRVNHQGLCKGPPRDRHRLMVPLDYSQKFVTFHIRIPFESIRYKLILIILNAQLGLERPVIDASLPTK